ncbi:putative DNA helicase [Microsporum audouinii]
MLERAVRCIESASQHVYLGSKHTFRTRRRLHPKFWNCNPDESAISLLYFYIVQSKSGKRLSAQHNDGAPFDVAFSATPLEFLYPPKTRLFARTYASEPKRSTVHGKNKRNISRTYYSASSCLTEESLDVGNSFANDVGLEESPDVLRKFLSDKGPRDYGAAWWLYRSSGSPEGLESELLSYLSTSQDPRDYQRCQLLLQSIEPANRSERDYLSAVRIALNAKSRAYTNCALELCEEATVRGKTQCWHYAFMQFVNGMDWENAFRLWNAKPDRLPDKIRPVDSLPLKSLANPLLALLETARQHNTKDMLDMSRYIIKLVISHDKLLMAVSMNELLKVFENSTKLKLFDRDDYIQAISTLQSSKIRSANGRSIMVYRNFRWRITEATPPRSLITRLLHMLCEIEVLEGVDYLLDEYRLHYGKPPMLAYHDALTVSARLGDTSTTLRFYHDYLADHGRAVSTEILTPLLYVHARTGDVKETQKWFNYFSELGVPPEVQYWNILLTAYSKNKDLEGALHTFQLMLQSGMAPDAVSFTILMGLSAGRGDVKAVLDLFDMAKRNGVRIHRSMFDTLVEVLCKHRRYPDAERVAEEATSKFPAKAMTRTWNIILWNYAYTIDITSVLRIQNRMQEAGIPFDGMTYAAMMSSLVRVGKTDSARKILRVLHKNHEIHLTLFHYAILLHGYVQEMNRDMVQVLYTEMMERFNKTGLSGTLAMLQSQINRDIRRARETMGSTSSGKFALPHAEELLKSAMDQLDAQDFSTKQPQPGAHGRPLREAFPTVFYEQLIKAYGRNNRGEKVGELFLEFSKKSRATLPDRLPHSPVILHALMVNFLSQNKHFEVKKCFEAALTHTLQRSRGINIQAALSRPTGPLAALKASGKNMPEFSYYNDTPRVLASHRFDLSHCISTYMRSLSSQNLHLKIADLVTQIEKLGFAFSTHNWSLYVNILCLSRDPASQIRAFTIFEEKFMPNYPGWRYIKRGYALRPEGATMEMDLMEEPFRRGKPGRMMGRKARALWAKVQPDYMQPTHLNILHLASALIDFRSRSIIDGGEEMNQLFSKAPKTYTAVATIPYLEEKFDTILRRYKADQENMDRNPRVDIPNDAVWTGGVLGDGNERIKTDEASPDLEGERIEDVKEYEDDPGSEWDPSEIPGQAEIFESTEPIAPLLESLLAEDMARRGRISTSKQPNTVPLAERILSTEDQWDLDNYKRLSTLKEKTAEH